MSNQISDAVLDAAYKAAATIAAEQDGEEIDNALFQDESHMAEMRPIIRAALEAALPHLQPSPAGQGDDSDLLQELRDVEDYFEDVDPNPIHLATVQAAIEFVAARQSVDFDDKELQFYREHVVNDLDNMLIDAGVFEVTHEGGYEACWANSMDALERLIDRQPVAATVKESLTVGGGQAVWQEPVAATRLFPEVLGSTSSPDAMRLLVTGFDVGPFFVHMGISDDESTQFSDKFEDMELWHVTHRASGFAIQKRIPTHTRAIWLAQQLMEFDVWDSSDRDSVLAALNREQTMQIAALRADAVSGDCQGQKMALIDGETGVGRG